MSYLQLLSIFCILLLSAYTSYHTIIYGPIKTLSDTWYYNKESGKHPAYIFQILIFSIAVMMIPGFMKHSNTVLEYILASTSIIGLVFVGTYPRFKLSRQSIQHYGGAILSAVSSILWSFILNKDSWLVLVLISWMILMIMLYSKTHRTSLVYWLELIAFYFVFGTFLVL